ncbi:bacillithiol biosynthesis BshC, partial [Candidatus Desantisbacteria bacterium]|nr:bacillithiol biosynthesis BshC [Candidatus Desantisbacteria bacterium]
MSVTINNKFINNPITYKKKLPAFYMTEYNKAEQFFPYAPYDYNVLADVIKRRLLSKYPRDESVKIIKETYKYFSAGKKVTENIELLKNNNTLAIVTGQQPDLMTGPLYIIYKALSAVRLADILNEKFSEYKFVPIFWTASDDHDIEEMNQFALLDQENNFKKFSFNIKAERVPAYRIDFKRQDVFELADFLKNNLRPSEYTERLINELKEVFTRTLNLNQLFILLMQRLFDDFGLIIIDGSNANL